VVPSNHSKRSNPKGPIAPPFYTRQGTPFLTSGTRPQSVFIHNFLLVTSPDKCSTFGFSSEKSGRPPKGVAEPKGSFLAVGNSKATSAPPLTAARGGAVSVAAFCPRGGIRAFFLRLKFRGRGILLTAPPPGRCVREGTENDRDSSCC